MITYQYECKYCEHSLEIKQKHDDKPKKKCPACKKHGLFKVISGGYGGYVYQEPSTVGHLAERNTNKLGTYHKQSIEKQTADNKIKAKKEAIRQLQESGKIPSGAKLTEPGQKKKAWYGELPKDKEKVIKSGNKNKIDTYIREGK